MHAVLAEKSLTRNIKSTIHDKGSPSPCTWLHF